VKVCTPSGARVVWPLARLPALLIQRPTTSGSGVFIDAILNHVNIVVSNYNVRTTQTVMFFDDDNM